MQGPVLWDEFVHQNGNFVHQNCMLEMCAKMCSIVVLQLISRTVQDITPIDLQVHCIAFNYRRIQAITTVTNKELILFIVCCLKANELSSRSRDIPKVALSYCEMYTKHSMEYGLLIKGERTVIPAALQDHFLAGLNE